MRILFILSFTILSFNLFSQSYYWVYLTDKSDISFDPYAYFDTKAIERRVQQNIAIYDKTDLPINENYINSISSIVNEVIGSSRWFNSVAIYCDSLQLSLVRQFPFVKDIQLIDNDTKNVYCQQDISSDFLDKPNNTNLSQAITRMGAEYFADANINGKGIRIAIFDGGFPYVDKHMAFRHLRFSNQIIKTYNFPNKCENVYGWNSHGTMVLSCIAGLSYDDKQLGLATGSEFLLARTEVGLEPAREEVWWLMAVEWADKNGANIINSSLGYGADRYKVKILDGKSSLVTRAANMAASKGILVCNAMGNEGDDKSWKTLIVPADADSILSVGGIDSHSNFNNYFSSFGPTYDGRLKPNVCACGGPLNVATKNNIYTTAYGTSFASPLVAGFAACAWQARPNLTNMQLKSEIEKSADLYPYYDYAMGYGVPQAQYFTSKETIETTPSFYFTEYKNVIKISVPVSKKDDNKRFFYHIRNKSGNIYKYEHLSLNNNDTICYIYINKTDLSSDCIIAAHYKDYTSEYTLKDAISPKDTTTSMITTQYHTVLTKHPTDEKNSNFGYNAKYYIQMYVSGGLTIGYKKIPASIIYEKSNSASLGFRYKYNLSKCYNIGFNADFSINKFRLNNSIILPLPYSDLIKKREIISLYTANLEFYQRFRLAAGGPILGAGFFIDLGAYISGIYSANYNCYFANSTTKVYSYTKLKSFDKYAYGVRARLGYEIISIYCQYRISKINFYHLPTLETGLELSIPF